MASTLQQPLLPLVVVVVVVTTCYRPMSTAFSGLADLITYFIYIAIGLRLALARYEKHSVTSIVVHVTYAYT